VSFFFWGGWECTWVYVFVHARTHTHCTWGARCEPRGRDETLGGPEACESRWTKSRQICIRICVQSTHVYIYARRRDEIQICFFPLTCFSFRRSKAKDVIVKLWTRIEIESEQYRPSIKGTKLLIEIKGIFIIIHTCKHRTNNIWDLLEQHQHNCVGTS
jgi:hypothetical protein